MKRLLCLMSGCASLTMMGSPIISNTNEQAAPKAESYEMTPCYNQEWHNEHHGDDVSYPCDNDYYGMHHQEDTDHYYEDDRRHGHYQNHHR